MQINSEAQQQQSQGTFFHHQDHKDRQAHYTKHKAHTWHQHIIRIVLVGANKESGQESWRTYIFQAVPVEAAMPSKLWALGSRTEVMQHRVPVNQEGKERGSIPLTGTRLGDSGCHKRENIPSAGQDSETSVRHNGCDKQLECTVAAG